MSKHTVKVRAPDGVVHVVDLEVTRTIHLVVDCGCWKHASIGQRFIVITTKSGAYIRRADAEHHFSEIDQSGPIVAAIEKLEL